LSEFFAAAPPLPRNELINAQSSAKSGVKFVIVVVVVIFFFVVVDFIAVAVAVAVVLFSILTSSRYWRCGSASSTRLR